MILDKKRMQLFPFINYLTSACIMNNYS